MNEVDYVTISIHKILFKSRIVFQFSHQQEFPQSIGFYHGVQ